MPSIAVDRHHSREHFTDGAEPKETANDQLPPPEQWVISQMNEMEVAEMIEKHIDFYNEDKDGNRRSVHLPTQFVRHFMRRHDDVLPTVVPLRRHPSSWQTEDAGTGWSRPRARHRIHHPRRSYGRSSRAARTAPRSA